MVCSDNRFLLGDKQNKLLRYTPTLMNYTMWKKPDTIDHSYEISEMAKQNDRKRIGGGQDLGQRRREEMDCKGALSLGGSFGDNGNLLCCDVVVTWLSKPVELYTSSWSVLLYANYTSTSIKPILNIWIRMLVEGGTWSIFFLCHLLRATSPSADKGIF